MGVIDRTIVLNLDCQKDRRSFILGSLSSLGYPGVNIEFERAPDYRDFSSERDLKLAAVRDGFPFFDYSDWGDRVKEPSGGMITEEQIEWLRRLRRPVKDANMSAKEAHRLSLRYVRRPIAITWGMCKMLRSVTERDSISLVIYDDMVLFFPSFVMTRCVGQFMPWAREYDSSNRGKQFEVLQISAGTMYFGSDWVRAVNNPKSIVRPGFHGNSDFATIVTPSGAQFLLDRISAVPYMGFATLFEKMADERPVIRGAYHTSIPGVVECGKSILSEID